MTATAVRRNRVHLGGASRGCGTGRVGVYPRARRESAADRQSRDGHHLDDRGHRPEGLFRRRWTGPVGDLRRTQGTRRRSVGNIWIVDTENHSIRFIDSATMHIRTLAGTGQAGSSGDQGPATKARLDRPHGIAVAPDGSFWIADTNNHRLRVVKTNE